MKGSEIFAEALKRSGIRYAFGIMGDFETEMCKAYRDGQVPFYLMRHEQAAAFAADVAGRLTGNAAICHSTIGPGATNLVTGVANAYQDRSPVIAVSPQVRREDYHQDTHQFVDFDTLFRQITKGLFSPTKASYIPRILNEAKCLAETERPGPVHLTLPLDVLEEDSEFIELSISRREDIDDLNMLREIANEIGAAKFPVIIIGNLVKRRGAYKELRQFVERYGIVAYTTFQGKGTLPNNCPYNMGVLSRHISQVRENFAAADLVICIGYDYIEGIKPGLWGNGKEKKVLTLDSVPSTASKYVKSDIHVVGEITTMLDCLTTMNFRTTFNYGDIDRLRTRLDVPEDADMRTPLRPERTIRALNNVLEDDDIVVSDVGWHKQFLGLGLKDRVGEGVIFSNGLSSMGFSVPGAIGAKVVRPEKRVVSVSGDGGFMMNVQELATVKKYGLPITFIVMNNNSLGLVETIQRKRYGESIDVDLENPHFVKLAESFGLVGYRVTNPKDIEDVLKGALESGSASIVEIPTDYSRVTWG